MSGTENTQKTAAIVLAAGQGKPMKSSVQKQFLELGGRPLITYALQRFEESGVNQIVLVTGKADVEYCREHIVKAFGFRKVTAVVAGGKERYHSVYEGLKALAGQGISHVLIHDGARPLVTHEVIEKALHCAALNKAAAPAVPLKDTVKLVKDGAVVRTLERSSLAAVQTPQVFWPDIIKGALTDAMNRGRDITDDCSAVEAMGVPVFITEGSYENIKITTPEDIAAAEAILERRGHK